MARTIDEITGGAEHILGLEISAPALARVGPDGYRALLADERRLARADLFRTYCRATGVGEVTAKARFDVGEWDAPDLIPELGQQSEPIAVFRLFALIPKE